jgi:hypothetical protein
MSVVRDAVRSVGEMAARSEATVAGRVFIEWQTLDRAPQ